jgi:hypothetical protein
MPKVIAVMIEPPMAETPAVIPVEIGPPMAETPVAIPLAIESSRIQLLLNSIVCL